MPDHRPAEDSERAVASEDRNSVCTPTIYDHALSFGSFHPHDERGEITVHFRPIRVDDEQLLRDFFASHSEQTIYLRYGMMLGEMTHERALSLVDLDGHYDFALIGLVGGQAGGGGGERIIAVGRYCVDRRTGQAEVAFVVHESYRGLGIATHLLYSLTTIIHEKGFAGITAQVIDGNRPMLQVMYEVLGPPSQSSYSCGERTLHWRLENRGYDIWPAHGRGTNRAADDHPRRADTRTL